MDSENPTGLLPRNSILSLPRELLLSVGQGWALTVPEKTGISTSKMFGINVVLLQSSFLLPAIFSYFLEMYNRTAATAAISCAVKCFMSVNM